MYSGWWLTYRTYPSEKYEFVSWDYEIPNKWKIMKFMFQTSNQYFINQTYGIIMYYTVIYVTLW